MLNTKSIEQLENDYWKEEGFPTSLIERCFRYRKIPVNDLSIEQVRLMLSQDIGVKYLLPKAISFLSANILSEGHLYLGDLLMETLRIKDSHWKGYEGGKEQLKGLLATNLKEIEITEDELLLHHVNTFLDGNNHTS